MKKRLAIILSGAAAAGVLSLAVPAGFAQDQTNTAPPTAIPPAPGTPGLPASPAAPQAIPGRPVPAQPAVRPPGSFPPRRLPGHLALRRAVQSLEMAKRDLKASPTDFDGHRDAAMDACDKAIQELNEALKHAPEPPPPVAAPHPPAPVPPPGTAPAPEPGTAPAPEPAPVPK